MRENVPSSRNIGIIHIRAAFTLPASPPASGALRYTKGHMGRRAMLSGIFRAVSAARRRLDDVRLRATGCGDLHLSTMTREPDPAGRAAATATSSRRREGGVEAAAEHELRIVLWALRDTAARIVQEEVRHYARCRRKGRPGGAVNPVEGDAVPRPSPPELSRTVVDGGGLSKTEQTGAAVTIAPAHASIGGESLPYRLLQLSELGTGNADSIKPSAIASYHARPETLSSGVPMSPCISESDPVRARSSTSPSLLTGRKECGLREDGATGAERSGVSAFRTPEVSVASLSPSECGGGDAPSVLGRRRNEGDHVEKRKDMGTAAGSGRILLLSEEDKKRCATTR